MHTRPVTVHARQFNFVFYFCIFFIFGWSLVDWCQLRGKMGGGHLQNVSYYHSFEMKLKLIFVHFLFRFVSGKSFKFDQSIKNAIECGPMANTRHNSKFVYRYVMPNNGAICVCGCGCEQLQFGVQQNHHQQHYRRTKSKISYIDIDAGSYLTHKNHKTTNQFTRLWFLKCIRVCSFIYIASISIYYVHLHPTYIRHRYLYAYECLCHFGEQMCNEINRITNNQTVFSVPILPAPACDTRRHKHIPESS